MIKPTEGYVKTTLDNSFYLLPYGQQIADLKSGMRLNRTGSFLWEQIRHGCTRESLLTALVQEYDADSEDVALLQADLEAFLRELSAHGLIFDDMASCSPTMESAYFATGPLTIAFHGPDSVFQTYFADFRCKPVTPDQRVFVQMQKPLQHRNGPVLIRNEEVIILDIDSDYVFLFPSLTSIHEMQVTKDGSQATVYCNSLQTPSQEEDLFHALRFAFLIIAAQKNLYVLHSASILYKDQAWLFSGCSGTGKSTHTRLWNDNYGTPFLNGDLNMIGMEDGTPIVYGIPWCGTSEIYTPASYPLGGIVFLQQAPCNQVTIPELHQQILSVSQRLISPSWTQQQLHQNLSFADNLCRQTNLFHLSCTKEPAAAETMKSTIDSLQRK